MPRLFVLSGPEIGRTLDVAGTAVLGRAPGCDVRLRDASISREHARLERVDGRWTIVDLGSRNGVTVDGARVERADLEDGDTFTLGQVELRFRAELEPAAGGAPAPTAEPAPAPPPARPAAPPAPPAPEPSAAPAAAAEGEAEEDDGEIELEGDWDAEAASDLAATHLAAAPATRPGAGRAGRDAGAAGAAAAGAPDERTARRRAALAGAGGAAVRAADDDARRRDLVGGKPVLQYRRVADREGFLAEDLAQQPLWVRLGVGLLVVAVFAAIAWGAFRLTTSLRDRPTTAVELGEE